MARVLVVDDDPHIRDVVSVALEGAGHEIVTAGDGAAGHEAFLARAPELVVLDVSMPRVDGLELCRRIRASSGPGRGVPILFLSARHDELDRIIGLEVGGDDYVEKPFSPRELVAKVKAMLRRVELDRGGERPAPALTHGALVIDRDRFEVSWAGRPIALTVTELGILETLLGRPGKVYSRGELVDLAYRFDHHITERTIDSHIKRIRKKFDAGGEPIETVFGVGYRLGTCRPP